ncbi:AraC family transcriptional regulator [Paraflavitalea sp. CAU 1676]|uniref:helix-turn-helix domain-containing protein n=1 Tax=Paraflavitalea sp. CAU 1676 TaxID=3032598 RepID=UPI0023D9C55B|nr:AraC family transcriptional regulator [Paraflavitalea sp. CAU 1676]MDF2192273.1 AraC family transcriptional regulator [Paraflavitalea sp. CAU 1676]
MELYIRNMVCNRCIMIVRQTLEETGLHPLNIKLGEVELAEAPAAPVLDTLKSKLEALGFELLDNQRQKTIEQIKSTIQRLIGQADLEDNHKFSALLSDALQKEYSYLSKLFSEVEGITIEKYVINEKIEKVKELMIYDKLSLNDIAFKMGYSSVAHLSAQFKKVTGFTPSAFRQLKED